MPGQQKARLIGYRYDALNHLTSHSRVDSVERQRFYCESRLVTEIQGDAHISIVQHGDQILAQQDDNSGVLDSTLLAADQQRSVLNVLQAKRPQAIVYSPYGHRTFESGLISLLGFNGQRPDPVTGHYLLGNGYRAFNPVLTRFNSPDNLSPFGKGGLNAYAYCQGDPVNRIDPTGHRFTTPNNLLPNVAGSPLQKVQFQIKPVRVLQISDDIRLIEDLYHGKPRLTISGHGNRDGSMRHQQSDPRPISPVELHSMIERRDIKLDNYSNLRVVMCYGADKPITPSPYFSSFAQRFSNVTELPVKAYHGKITVFEPETSNFPYEKRFQGKYFGIDKKSGRAGDVVPSYSPDYFKPFNPFGSIGATELVNEIRGLRK